MVRNVLEVKDLKMYYFTNKGVVKAVDNISFNLRKGEVLGLAGGRADAASPPSVLPLWECPPPHPARSSAVASR